MNYREWLLHRAQRYEAQPNEPQVLRYTSWRNQQSVQDWIRRSEAAQMASFMRHGQPAASSAR